MGRAIFLANPQLNIDDVVVDHSSALGRRAGEAIAAPGNSGFMLVSAVGDAGDGLDHSIQFRGQDIFPRYIPRNDAGADQSTALQTFTTAGSLAVTDVKRLALVTCYDRLHLVTLSGSALLSVYTWSGSAFTLRASLEVDQDIQGGIAACARGDNIYIGICDSEEQLVSFYRFSAISFALGEIAEGAVAVNNPSAISMASNGASFIFLHEYDNGDDTYDVKLAYGGNLARLRQKSLGFVDMFNGDWVAEGNIAQPFICWSPTYKYLAAFQTGASGSGGFKVAQSFEGDDWSEFEDIIGAVNHPAVTTPTGNAKNVAIAPEGRRVFGLRATAATLGDPPTNLVMQYFNGRREWSGELDADGGLGILNGTGLGIANWRGTIWGAWASASGTIQLRKWNTLSTLPSDTAGHSTRAVERGEPNFIDGPEDDTRVALFFDMRGALQKDDVFTIPTAYDRRGANVLSEVRSATWRANDGGEEWIRFDAGVDRVFPIDTIAIFGSNLPGLTLELDDDPTFATPEVSQAIDGTITTAAVVGASKNYVTFASGTFQQFEHSESRRWVTFSSGVSGIFPILENTGNRLKVDGDVTGAGGTATIFGDRIWHFFGSVQTGYRYLRLVTPEVELPDGYYEISRVIFGIRHELPRNFSSGFLRSPVAMESPLQLKSGARLVTQLNDEQRHQFSLPFQVIKHDIGLASLRGFYAWTNGMREQFAFWPHPSSPMVEQIGAYLCRVEQPLQLQHLNARYYSGNLVIGSEV